MKKNFIIVLLGAVTCIAVASGIWLAVYLGRHIHDYGGWVTDNGYHWRECSADGCGEKVIEKSAHSDADNDGKCDICLIEHEHPFVKTVTEPNCTKQGYTEYACPCGYHYRGDYTDELGHDFGEDNLCTRCGYLKHEHEYIEKVIPPTCTEGGYTRGDCKYCTAGYFSAHTDPLGHNFIDGKCTRCGEYNPTDGIGYTLSDDGNYYICSGMGTATGTQVIIAPEYNGKPVTVIAQRAFYNNRNITSVIIPDTVTSIGASAFEYCTALSEITIPDSVTSVGSKAFYNCKGMVGATVGGYIGNDMFQYCTKLETVVICDGVTSIGSWAFAGCEKLETATVPDSVTSIGEHAFRNCKSLKEINIPDGVTEIGDGTFYYCTGLTELTIPDSVTSIGENAFFGLEIRSATIPMAAVKNMRETYHVTRYLTTVVITSGEAIYEEAFKGWEITSITLPATVRVIGSKAFFDCPLTDITYDGTVEQWDAIEKSKDWYNYNTITVHCTNGDIICL